MIHWLRFNRMQMVSVNDSFTQKCRAMQHMVKSSHLKRSFAEQEMKTANECGSIQAQHVDATVYDLRHKCCSSYRSTWARISQNRIM